jgi:hypothetical protein
MPDITMCEDKECPKKNTCFRFLADPTLCWQPYFVKSPRKGKKCEYYWWYDWLTKDDKKAKKSVDKSSSRPA